ncbi:hypothetical protein AN944_00347 [Shewanella sp. P1-14-1]|uniref:hypothetical protein n=1 Tax=Shewanella sp. P1-14-1 TaxID=1723761 RepID=UPI0006D68916|nr:hypothetical protein [Shewanella sp. P1-14-1]KPZ73199.1 hypothetical protein AN944_00347 [Shewanella sp. P1-14-1]
MSAISHSSFRNPQFDVFFILLLPVFAIAVASIANTSSILYNLIFSLNIFFLGYHHVISTYTRLGISQLSDSETRFLTLILPFIVIAFVFTCIYINSSWLISTIYLHWQWWHYTRQSEGVSKAIRYKVQSSEGGNELFNRIVFYAVPIAAFSFMSARNPNTFLFMEVRTLPISMSVAIALVCIVIILQCIWLYNQIGALRSGKLKPRHFGYLVSHQTIYWVAYALFTDINVGWLAINIWHNSQYISFVWHYNSQKFQKGFDKNHPVISWLSQQGYLRVFCYFSVSILVTYFFYSGVDWSIKQLSPYTSLPLIVIAYQSINFHHYIVDTCIWKLRKKSIRENI